VEDAQAAMALYRTIQEDYEKQFRIKRDKADTKDGKKQNSRKVQKGKMIPNA
jgi:hypothetical protein